MTYNIKPSIPSFDKDYNYYQMLKAITNNEFLNAIRHSRSIWVLSLRDAKDFIETVKNNNLEEVITEIKRIETNYPELLL